MTACGYSFGTWVIEMGVHRARGGRGLELGALPSVDVVRLHAPLRREGDNRLRERQQVKKREQDHRLRKRKTTGYGRERQQVREREIQQVTVEVGAPPGVEVVRLHASLRKPGVPRS